MDIDEKLSQLEIALRMLQDAYDILVEQGCMHSAGAVLEASFMVDNEIAELEEDAADAEDDVA